MFAVIVNARKPELDELVDEHAIPDLKSEASEIRAASELFCASRVLPSQSSNTPPIVTEHQGQRPLLASGLIWAFTDWRNRGRIFYLVQDGVVRSTAAVAKHVGLFSVSHADKEVDAGPFCRNRHRWASP
jgi:hypothetical protein